jgi:hypothetical protein
MRPIKSDNERNVRDRRMQTAVERVKRMVWNNKGTEKETGQTERAYGKI